MAAGSVLALPFVALAQDASVLNGKDDIEFARALVDNGYPDLAERLLAVKVKAGSAGGQADAQVAAIKLDVAQDAASRIEDPVARNEALVKVLADKEKFIEDFKGKDAAEDVRNALPDLYNLIGDAITEALKKTTDNKALESLRSKGDALFTKAEQAMKDRITVLNAVVDKTEADEHRLEAARYNYPHTMYFHAKLFPEKSAERMDLCKAALTKLDEFDLQSSSGDEPSFLTYYAYIDSGLCLQEIGKPDQAIQKFDKTISLRESWGPMDEKTGVWPMPAEARDVADLVGYATYQKVVVLRETKKPAEVVAVCKDFFASMPKASDSPYSRVLARELADAQLATGK
jgi:tetratricopeptide (TPR) repeat protein